VLVDLTASPLWRPVTSKPTCADSNHREAQSVDSSKGHNKPIALNSAQRAIEAMPLDGSRPWLKVLPPQTLSEIFSKNTTIVSNGDKIKAFARGSFVFFTKDILTKVVAPLIFAQAAMPERESAKCRQALKAISVLRDPICRFSHVTKVADITSA